MRRNCRDAFKQARLLERILPDIDHLLDIPPEAADAREHEMDADDDAKPEDWWGPADAEIVAQKRIEGVMPDLLESLDVSEAEETEEADDAGDDS